MAAWFNIVSPGRLGLLSHSGARSLYWLRIPEARAQQEINAHLPGLTAFGSLIFWSCVFLSWSASQTAPDSRLRLWLNFAFSVPNCRFSHLLGVKWYSVLSEDQAISGCRELVLTFGSPAQL